MPKYESPQNVIDTYRKRQQMMPFIVGGLAVLLVAIGIIVLVVSMNGSDGQGSVFDFLKSSTETPTPTFTVTPTPVTPTVTSSMTPTITLSPTITITATISGPFEYTVQDGDTCWDIAAKYNVDLEVLLAINAFGTQCSIQPGKKILIPGPNSQLPTSTPMPENLPRGTRIDYTIRVGDTLDIIAAALNSSVEAIMQENKMTDANKLTAGEVIKVPANIVTRTPTLGPTSTSVGPQVAPTHSENPAAGSPQPTTAPRAATTQPAVQTAPTETKPAS